MIKKYKKLISMLLTSTSLLIGCGDNYLVTTKEFDELIDSQVDNLSDLEIGKLYYDYFNNYKVEYKNDEFLVSDKEVKKFKKMASSMKSCSFRFNGTSSDMLNLIINNTDQYIAKHSSDGYINAVDSNYLYDIHSINAFSNYNRILETINKTFEVEIDKLLSNHLSNNTAEDLCKMKDLVVVLDTKTETFSNDETFTLASYLPDENKIVIYLDSFLYEYNSSVNKYVSSDINSISFVTEETLKKLSHTVIHEINHMRQYICDDRKEEGQLNNKITYSNDISPSLIESSAESAVFNETNSFFFSDNSSSTYYEEMLFENEFLLLSVTDNSTSIDDYYASMFDSDISRLLAYFNLESDNDIKSFLNILREKDACLLRNNMAANISSNYGDMSFTDAKNIVGCSYKIDLLRLILRNLIEYNLDKKLSAKEAYYLKEQFISVTCKDIYLDDYEPDEMFFDQFLILNKEFNNYLKDEYHLSDTEFFEVMYNQDNSVIKKFPKLELIISNVFKEDTSTNKIIIKKK